MAFNAILGAFQLKLIVMKWHFLVGVITQTNTSILKYI